jgi:hypothetical protein
MFRSPSRVSKILCAFPGPAVTSLGARAVNIYGHTACYLCLLIPESFACIVAAFPNLTHLDVSLNGKPMVCTHQPIPSALTVTFRPKIHYRAGFAELLMLKHLGLRVHQRVRIAENE